MNNHCDLCKFETKTRYLDLFVNGSEGLNICHSCEMKMVESARNIQAEAMRNRKKSYQENKS